MTKLLYGKPIIEEQMPLLRSRSMRLAEKGHMPCLAVVRLGENSEDLSYEKSIKTKATDAGVTVKSVCLPIEAAQEELRNTIVELGKNEEVDGILVFRPLPAGYDEKYVLSAIPVGKDVDGVTALSMAGIFSGKEETGFAPCTAEAVLKMLDHYGYDPAGKSVVVVGRSLVIGKPVAMLLLDRNATVSICHSRTKDIDSVISGAEILIVCAGLAKNGPGSGIRQDQLKEGQVVIDVGIHWSEEDGLYGDVAPEVKDGPVEAVSPVPGGLGNVTTLVMFEHVIRAAER